VAQRRADVLRLRAAGLTFKTIADQLRPQGMSYTAAHAAQDASRALQERKTELGALSDTHVTLELERADVLERHLQRALVAAAGQQDTRMTLAIADRLMRLSAMRGRLLGLEDKLPATRPHGPSSAPATGAPGPGGPRVSYLAEAAARRQRRRDRYAG
jgi:hypothetical protein